MPLPIRAIWLVMAKAIDFLRSHPGQPLYQALFFEQHVKFIYPLSSLTWLDLLQARLGWDWPTIIKLINKLCWLIPLAMIPVCVALVWREAERGVPVAAGQRQACALLVVRAAVTLSFYPLLLSFQAGQIQTVITLLVALVLLAWQRRQLMLAGLLLGICCSIKPQWLVLLPWALIHRQHRMAAALLLSAAVLATPSVCRTQPFGRGSERDLVLAYVLVADCVFGVTKQIAWPPATPLQSTFLFGAGMILVLLARLAERHDGGASAFGERRTAAGGDDAGLLPA